MALLTHAVPVDVVAFLANRAGVGILRSALQAEVYLGAFLAGKALARPLQVEVQTLSAATAVPLGVAGVVLFALAVYKVRSLLAGETVSWVVVNAGQAGQLARQDANSICIGLIFVSTNCAFSIFA